MRFAKKNIIFNKTHVIRRLKHVFDFSIKLLSLSFSLKYEFKFRISVEGDALNYRPMITPKFIFHSYKMVIILICSSNSKRHCNQTNSGRTARRASHFKSHQYMSSLEDNYPARHCYLLSSD
jgi:hypothetical protein